MRIPYFTVGLLVIALAITMSLPVAAQSPAPNSMQGQPRATMPSPSTPPAASESPTAPGQAGTAAGNAQSQASDDNPLNLTEEQKTKLRPILTEERQQMDSVRNDTTMTQEQKIAKANEIRQAASPKIKAVLTPEQIQKLAEMQKAQQNQGAPTSPASPPQK